MLVRLSRLELGERQSVVRLDRHGKVVEVLRPGDSCYGYWLEPVRPGPDEERAGGGGPVVAVDAANGYNFRRCGGQRTR